MSDFDPQSVPGLTTCQYAPIVADGPLPPGLTDTTVAASYRAFRPDLRAKRVLATLGIKPGHELANRVLRRALDQPDARSGKGEDEATERPPLFLAMYQLLRNLAAADEVYKTIVQPAEQVREDLTFLVPSTFGDHVAQNAARFADAADPLASGSEAEALALFALAFGLLQPDDAVAIIGPVAALGRPFQTFFGIAAE